MAAEKLRRWLGPIFDCIEAHNLPYSIACPVSSLITAFAKVVPHPASLLLASSFLPPCPLALVDIETLITPR